MNRCCSPNMGRRDADKPISPPVHLCRRLLRSRYLHKVLRYESMGGASDASQSRLRGARKSSLGTLAAADRAQRYSRRPTFAEQYVKNQQSEGVHDDLSRPPTKLMIWTRRVKFVMNIRQTDRRWS